MKGLKVILLLLLLFDSHLFLKARKPRSFDVMAILFYHQAFVEIVDYSFAVCGLWLVAMVEGSDVNT
jgi:hypothetical protein